MIFYIINLQYLDYEYIDEKQRTSAHEVKKILADREVSARNIPRADGEKSAERGGGAKGKGGAAQGQASCQYFPKF